MGESDAQLTAGIINQLAQLDATDWLPKPRAVTVERLAGGGYHKNFLVKSAGVVTVARWNRTSQWGLTQVDQLRREFLVLTCVQGSGVTPVPLALLTGDPPFLIESFIEGTPFRYGSEIDHAATAIAAVHCQPIRDLGKAGPVESAAGFLLSDGSRWLHRAEPSGRARSTTRLLRRALLGLKENPRPIETPSVIVHTDLIHSNLLSTAGGCCIVDWEGARLGPAAWDLAYFLSPVTRRWAPAECAPITAADEGRFLQIYAAATGIDLDCVITDVKALLPFVIFRALAWCVGYQESEQLEPEIASTIGNFTDPDYVASVISLP